MSGVEVLGIALGVLPLLISALEHYEDALRPIRIFRAFTTKAQQFCDQLETQRIIFRAECELLLSAVANRITAREMLNDPEHEKWKSEAISDLFGRSLGSLGAACASVIMNMNKKLVEIGDFSKEFVDIPNTSSLRSRNWAKRMRSKLKLSFSEPKLRESIADLETLNATFRILSNQVVRFDSQESNKEKRSQSTISAVATEKKTEELKKFQIVRTAARLLYDALAKACTLHTEHFAKFFLEAYCLGGGGQKNLPSQVRFKLTFSHSQLAQHSSILSKSPHKCLRFEVESVLGDEQSIYSFCNSRMMTAPSKGKEKASKEQPLAATMPEGPSLTTITTRIGNSPSSASASRLEGGASLMAQNANSQSTLPSRSLCSDLQEIYMRVGSPSPNTYIAMLERSTTSNHLIYCPTQSELSGLEDSSISLTQVLRPGASRGGIPQYLRLSIARSLSIAVLQFHTTPWFKDSWQSDNVCFLEDKSKPSFPLIHSPHLTVRLALDDENSPNMSKIQNTSPKETALAPNLVLFILGVMLLELAYGAPFSSLLEPGDFAVSEDSNVVKFIAARRLADNVGVHLGPRYARLVRKCLRCDFGSGEDLDNMDLQERLYDDVVCQLDGLEKGFRQLQVDE